MTATPIAPPEALGAAPAKPRRAAKASSLAVSYTPELQNPAILANCPGGSLMIGDPAGDWLLILNPGLNVGVNAEHWEAAKALPHVQDLLGALVIQEIEADLETAKTPEGDELVLSLMPVEQVMALRLIHACRSLPQLDRWAKTDERPAVQQSARRRYEAIKQGEG